MSASETLLAAPPDSMCQLEITGVYNQQYPEYLAIQSIADNVEGVQTHFVLEPTTDPDLFNFTATFIGTAVDLSFVDMRIAEFQSHWNSKYPNHITAQGGPLNAGNAEDPTA